MFGHTPTRKYRERHVTVGSLLYQTLNKNVKAENKTRKQVMQAF